MESMGSASRLFSWVAVLVVSVMVVVGSGSAFLQTIGERAGIRAAVTKPVAPSPASIPNLLPDDFDIRKAVAIVPLSEMPAGSSVENWYGLAVAAPAAAMEQAAPNLVRVGSSAVNLRAGPWKGAARVQVLAPGQQLAIGVVEQGWAAVTTLDGVSGWVAARYLDLDGATPNTQQVASAD